MRGEGRHAPSCGGGQDLVYRKRQRPYLAIRALSSWIDFVSANPPIQHFVSVLATFGPRPRPACRRTAEAWCRVGLKHATFAVKYLASPKVRVVCRLIQIQHPGEAGVRPFEDCTPLLAGTLGENRSEFLAQVWPGTRVVSVGGFRVVAQTDFLPQYRVETWFQ